MKPVIYWKSALARRTALVLLLVPSFVVSVLWETLKTAKEYFDDIPDLARAVWRGR